MSAERDIAITDSGQNVIRTREQSCLFPGKQYRHRTDPIASLRAQIAFAPCRGDWMSVLRRVPGVVAAASLVFFTVPFTGHALADVPTCQGKTATITGSGTINGTAGDDVIVGSTSA